MNEKTNLHYRYNFFYPLCILLGIIILLITVKWGSVDDLVKYITFGLTLTSLFLALIAIVYAIISNTSFSQHLGSLRSATESVSGTTASLTRMSDILETKLAEIPDLIRGVELKVDQTREEVARSSDVKEKPVIESESRKGPKLIDSLAELIPSFLSSSSFNGRLALYTVQLAYKTKKPFKMDEVWAGTGLSREYGYAYIVATGSFEIIDFAEKDGMINVTAINENMPDLKPQLLEWLEKQKENNPERWGNIDTRIKSTITPIEDYFED